MRTEGMKQATFNMAFTHGLPHCISIYSPKEVVVIIHPENPRASVSNKSQLLYPAIQQFSRMMYLQG